MSKRRPSMVDEVEFPNKTRQFLDFVGVTRSSQESDIEPVEEATHHHLSLNQICLPSQQPRRYFEASAMESLVASIQEHGILQPLLVRPLKSGFYELVAGERRYRAAQQLQLEQVPVVIRDLDDRDAVQVSLLENLQREDLNPVEETEAILQLLSIRLDCSSEEIISLLNHVANLQKQGTEITNNVVRNQWETLERVFTVIGRLTPDSFRSHRLPLLNLPKDILEVLRQGQIEYTKARTLAQIKAVNERQALLQETLNKNLSVREIKKRLQPQITSSPDSVVQTDTLPNRMRDVYRKVKQARTWEDPRKAKALEKLLAQIEALME
ncbi:MAG: ParB/RepB/Spo0J family partition protein [Cyanobacteria bacterium RM1_2_2]|nr:ParB/RepB/Spo0J family partition protein [Cyanobacteria bacterium RM1_2_2]